MSTLYLCLERKRIRSRLSVFDKAGLAKYCREVTAPYRVSPIFPVAGHNSTAPTKRKFLVGFFALDRPFAAIAALLKRRPRQEHHRYWFTHGLCSLVVFAEKRALLDNIRNEISEFGLRGDEFWQIDDGKVARVTWRLSPPVAWNVDEFAFAYDGFAPDVTSTFDELSHSLNAAVRLAAQFMPSELLTLKRLSKAIREIVAELAFLCKISETPPAYFSKAAVDVLLANPVERQKMINQRIGHVVQITSSLSYAIGQGFSGTIPLMQSDCSLKTFSLLGIGSAYHALSCFSRFVELTFQENPVDEVITHKFHSLEDGLPVPTNPAQHHVENGEWDDQRWDVDTYLNDVKKFEKKLNLVYFSGRLGFREAEFSVTAAQQVLLNACTSEWSLMTFTHEMMHAHVRGLLSAIFADPSQRFRFETPREIFGRFYDYLEAPPKTRVPKNFVDSLRFLLLAYAGRRKQFQSLAEAAIFGSTEQLDLEFPQPDKLAVALSDTNREINEIFVHIIDFNYFYDCKAKTYLGLIWRSWVPVPIVLEDVQNYLWRSLVTLGSQQTGDANTRFEAAWNVLIKTLNGLRDAVAQRPILIDRALEYLNVASHKDALLIKFSAALPIVDMIQKFLCASHIHGALYDDENAEQVDDEYHYRLETGEFKETKLVSPIALAADRLRRALNNDISAIENGHAAAWLFLACRECAHQERPT